MVVFIKFVHKQISRDGLSCSTDTHIARCNQYSSFYQKSRCAGIPAAVSTDLNPKCEKKKQHLNNYISYNIDLKKSIDIFDGNSN